MRNQGSRPVEWQCTYCNRPVPAAVNHKCLEHDRAKDAEPPLHWEVSGQFLANEQSAVPLIFYDSADKRRRLNLLADALERHGGRVSIQNAALLASDLREAAIAIEARKRTDPEEGLDPKGESAGPKDIAQ